MDVLNVDYMLGLVPVLLGYLPLTLQLAGTGMVLALILACLFAVVRVLRIPVLNQLTIVFISFFRGTPLLVQLFLFYYGLPQLVSALTVIDGITATIMGLTMHFSAYMAESIRAAIVGVDRSLTEAALSGDRVDGGDPEGSRRQFPVLRGLHCGGHHVLDRGGAALQAAELPGNPPEQGL